MVLGFSIVVAFTAGLIVMFRLSRYYTDRIISEVRDNEHERRVRRNQQRLREEQNRRNQQIQVRKKANE